MGQGKSPDILVCLSENHSTQCFGSLTSFGSSDDPSSNLSTLAKTGLSFTNAFCSNAGAGRTAFPILTGRPFDPAAPMWGEKNLLPWKLKQVGYETALFGSWNWTISPKKAGFDHWGILSDSSQFYNPTILSDRSSRKTEGHATDLITDLFLDWFRNHRQRNKPFFVLLSYNGAQRPWIPPIRFLNEYNEDWFETPGSFFSDFKGNAPANKYQRMNVSKDLDLSNDLFFSSSDDENSSTFEKSSVLGKNLEAMNDEQRSAWQLAIKPQNEAFARERPTEDFLTSWKFQRFLKNYLRCILAIDQSVGRLMDSLEPETYANLTFIYTAQKGRFTGQKGWFGCDWMYDPSIRVPLVITNPDPTNLPIDEQALIRDHDLNELIAGLAHPTDEKREGAKDRALFFTHSDYPGEAKVSPHVGIRSLTHKIIHYFPFDEWEFFDLIADPEEKQNLYLEPTHAGEIVRYKKKLEEAVMLHGFRIDHDLYSENWKRQQRSPEKRTR